MIVILEGADNSGKSTLAKRLSLETGLSVVHPGGPPVNVADAIIRCMEQQSIFTMSTEVDFIYDRVTCISDRIYRGNPDYHKVFDQYQRAISMAKNVLVIYCNPSIERLTNFDDHVTQAHETDEVVEYAKKNVNRIISEYDDVMHTLSSQRHINIFEYNFEEDEDGIIFSKIRSMIHNGRDC